MIRELSICSRAPDQSPVNINIACKLGYLVSYSDGSLPESCRLKLALQNRTHYIDDKRSGDAGGELVKTQLCTGPPYNYPKLYP